MNDELTLVVETESKSGTPALRVSGGKAPFEQAEMAEMEHELRRRYDKLARINGGSVTLCSHQFEVAVERGSNARQPKLVLRLVGSNGIVPHPRLGAGLPWTEGFFQELHQLLDKAPEPLPLHEKGAMATVLEELRSVAGTSSESLGLALLAGYLASAEQHCHSHDSARAGVYVMAWRGLSRFLPEADGSGVIATARPAAALTSAGAETPTVHWLRRLFRWLPGFAENGDPRE